MTLATSSTTHVNMSGAPSGLVARLSGVSLRYAKTIALDAVDLAVPAGCMVGLIGPDGVGKSSLLALISGARRVQQGTVEVLGGNMQSRRHRDRVCPSRTLITAVHLRCGRVNMGRPRGGTANLRQELSETGFGEDKR
mgnify:CR=1 FL=1